MSGTRILFLGTSGSGKTTTARRASQRLGIPNTELDSIRHRENWNEMPDDEFRQIVGEIAARPDWIIDGNYGCVRDITIPRATQVAWIDPEKQVVMAQALWRSLTRAVSRKPLWNNNRERFSDWFRPDHAIRWAWSTHADRRSRFAEQMDTRWVRLRSRRQVNDWLGKLKV